MAHFKFRKYARKFYGGRIYDAYDSLPAKRRRRINRHYRQRRRLGF